MTYFIELWAIAMCFLIGYAIKHLNDDNKQKSKKIKDLTIGLTWKKISNKEMISNNKKYIVENRKIDFSDVSVLYEMKYDGEDVSSKEELYRMVSGLLIKHNGLKELFDSVKS